MLSSCERSRARLVMRATGFSRIRLVKCVFSRGAGAAAVSAGRLELLGDEYFTLSGVEDGSTTHSFADRASDLIQLTVRLFAEANGRLAWSRRSSAR